MSTKNIKKAAEQEAEDLQEGYDQSEKEYTVPKTTIEVLGKDFEIVSMAPEWVQLFVARYGRGKDKEVPADKYMDFLVKVLGDDVIDYLLEELDNESPQGVVAETVEKIMAVWTPEGAKKKK